MNLKEYSIMKKFKFNINQEIIITGDNEQEAGDVLNGVDLGQLDNEQFNGFIEYHNFVEVLSVEEIEDLYPFNEGDEYWTAEYNRGGNGKTLKAIKSVWDTISEDYYHPRNIYFKTLDDLFEDAIKQGGFEMIIVIDFINKNGEIYKKNGNSFDKLRME